MSATLQGFTLVPPRYRSFSPQLAGAERGISLDSMPQEFPSYGHSDFRQPAVEVYQPETGSRILNLKYDSYQIFQGKPKLQGLPATYIEEDGSAQTLLITLVDSHLGLVIELSYTAFEQHPVITRSVKLLNDGQQRLEVRRLLSASVDFESDVADYELIQLSGAWARERDTFSTPLRPGVQSISSARGISSHQHNPFYALAEKGTAEENGSIYGFNLVYSGNFLGQVEVDQFEYSRAQLGLNPFDFNWQLEPGATLQSPEAVLVFSECGLGGMSRALHRFYREHLIPCSWRNTARPILLNNWEATYFDFDASKIKAIASAGAELGVELFVLDDGWFGQRNDDNSSLGDWVVNLEKLPDGLEDLAEKVKQEGLQFGLWFEPEMVSRDSDLYRAHPDWCIHISNRPRTEGRNQLVLDFSRNEVREAIYNRIASILRNVPITYVKWDMNRSLTEIGSAGLGPMQQQETAHRYVLGLYEFMDRITREFPNVLFEGCSGGGARFDPGILSYMPQIWASDNTDAITRLQIQYGTSLAYPLSCIGAHVSASPNHQVGRSTPLRTRADVAFTGAFGYELDLGQLTGSEKEEVSRQIEFYKKVRPLLMEGDLYRLKSPYDSMEAAWMVVSLDRAEALVTHLTILNKPNAPARRLRLLGLNSAATYQVNLGRESLLVAGDVLQNRGLLIPLVKNDFMSFQWHLIKYDH